MSQFLGPLIPRCYRHSPSEGDTPLQTLIHKCHTLSEHDPRVPQLYRLIHKCHTLTEHNPCVPHLFRIIHKFHTLSATPSQNMILMCHTFKRLLSTSVTPSETLLHKCHTFRDHDRNCHTFSDPDPQTPHPMPQGPDPKGAALSGLPLGSPFHI